jgi:hypothetical protein
MEEMALFVPLIDDTSLFLSSAIISAGTGIKTGFLKVRDTR